MAYYEDAQGGGVLVHAGVVSPHPPVRPTGCATGYPREVNLGCPDDHDEWVTEFQEPVTRACTAVVAGIATARPVVAVGMRAIIQEQYGGPDVLTLAERPDPKVAPGEVLIRVKSAGVNPVDWKLGAGYLDAMMEARFPIIPGWDVSGVVEAVGLDVHEYRVGDEVVGYARKDWVANGTYAELVAANVRHIAAKPRALDWNEAAGLPLAGLTAYQMLDRARIAEGDTVVVHAAAGGVGTFATQLAVARGARVIGTASERNHDFLRELGAEPVTYGDGLVERVRALAPEGIDAAVDCVGGESIDASRELLKDLSRLVSVADPRAEELGGASMWVRPSAADLAELSRLADAGELRVFVDRVLPLEEAAEAWRLSQEGRARGKIVLSVS